MVILSYLKPRGVNQNYSTYLFKINSALYNELEEQDIDAGKINQLVTLLRKFSTNIFKSQNEELIRQVGLSNIDIGYQPSQNVGACTETT